MLPVRWGERVAGLEEPLLFDAFLVIPLVAPHEKMRVERVPLADLTPVVPFGVRTCTLSLRTYPAGGGRLRGESTTVVLLLR